jgi:hypothetical protein
MFDQRTGFDSVDPERSAEAFRELAAGKVITREKFDQIHNDLVENPSYTTLFRSHEHFRRMYQHLGYELVFNDKRHFFFMRELSQGDDKDYNRNAFKVQVALLIIGRYFAQSGRDLQYLESVAVGLREDDIQAIIKDDEYSMMLRSAEFKEGFEAALIFLRNRGFVFETGVNRYILSPAGMHFLEVRTEGYQASSREEAEAIKGAPDSE